MRFGLMQSPYLAIRISQDRAAGPPLRRHRREGGEPSGFPLTQKTRSTADIATPRQRRETGNARVCLPAQAGRLW